MRRRTRRLGRGLLAGLAGGLIASWTMNQLQTWWSKAAGKMQRQPEAQRQQEQAEAEAENATMTGRLPFLRTSTGSSRI